MTPQQKSRREFLKNAVAATAISGWAAAVPAGFAEGFSGRAAGTQDTAPNAFTGPGSLRAHAAARGLLVGCAVVPERLENEPDYAKVVAEQASILVPENAMKWQALRPAPDRFDFHGADTILAFAQAHDQKV